MIDQAAKEIMPGRGSILSGMGESQLPRTKQIDMHVLFWRE